MGFEHNDIAIMGGLRAALEEETPMFERNDIVTVYKMNEAIAEGGGGGGGEDITTATITFINTGGEGTSYGVNIPSVIYDDCFDYNHTFLDPESYNVTDSTDVIATLYKGKVIYPLNSIYDGDAETMPTSSGGVSIDIENNAIVVTGDGTLTWVGSQGL